MATKVLGIELGDRLIKVSETTMGPGARKVSACALFQTPPDAVSDGEIKNPGALALALKENLQKNGIRNKKVVFTIASGRVAVREVTIPPVRENRVKAVIEANAADYFPVDMSGYQMTHVLLERKAAGEDAGCRVLVMAAPAALLEGYFELAAMAGLSVQAVDYVGNSQYRLLETLHNDGITMYVDVGGSFSVTTVMQKSRLLMQRTFPGGVDDYVLAFMNATGKTGGEFIPALTELCTKQFNLDALKQSAPGEYLSRLAGNISRMADYYNSSNWDEPIDRLVLTGIGAGVAWLREAVAESAELPVTVMQKLDKISAPGSLQEALPRYISTVGCAAAPVDFIPERFSKAKKRESKKKESVSLGVTMLTVCVLGALALSASAYFNYTAALEQKQQLQTQVSELLYTENVRNNFLAYDKYSGELMLLESALKSPNDGLKQFIEELERKMPAEISILSASCTKDGVDMNITVGTKTAAAKTIQQLRAFESIESITVGQLTDQKDDGGLSAVSFSVQCRYKYKPTDLTRPGPSPKAAGVQAAAPQDLEQ